MKVTVVGCGRWGATIAWYLDSIGHDVTVYGLADAPQMIELQNTRKNSFLELPLSIRLTTDISAVRGSDVTVISINSQGLRGLMEELRDAGLCSGTFVLCMKGLEISTGKRLSQVVSEFLTDGGRVAVWVGPGHPQEFYAGIPNCMVIDSEDEGLKRMLVDSFSSGLIRFYYGRDLIGNEIGAALKNVVGIAAGMLDGLGMTTLKGALMSRGTHEVARFIKASGGNELSAYGLCHLGDYEATVFSKYSHNRMFGEKFVRGETYTDLAEGYYTAEAVERSSRKMGVEMPICHGVYNILYNGVTVRDEIEALFARELKMEF